MTQEEFLKMVQEILGFTIFPTVGVFLSQNLKGLDDNDLKLTDGQIMSLIGDIDEKLSTKKIRSIAAIELISKENSTVEDLYNLFNQDDEIETYWFVLYVFESTGLSEFYKQAEIAISYDDIFINTELLKKYLLSFHGFNDFSVLNLFHVQKISKEEYDCISKQKAKSFHLSKDE